MGMPEEKLENIAKQSLEFVSLDYEKYKNRSPFQLSGGQMRKVAIAGVIALKPQYLILDEPAAGLDPVGRDDLFEKISKMVSIRFVGSYFICCSKLRLAYIFSKDD